MSDNDSDYFFSALEILSDTAVAASADRDDHQTPIYADDSILMCSLPETPCSDSTPSAIITTTVSPILGQTIDPLSYKDFRAQPMEEAKGRLMVETISSHDYDEQKNDDIAGNERIEDENVNPSFVPDTSGGSGDRKDGDEAKGRLMGEVLSYHDSNEEKHDGIVGKERIEDQNINPCFAPETNAGFGDCMDGDDSRETMVPVKKPRLDFVDVKITPKKPDQRFEDSDILEIAAMRGIHFPRPKWWRPGGYGAQKHQSCDRDNLQALNKAEDFILMRSLQEMARFSKSTPSAVFASTVSPLIGKVIDSLSWKDFHPQPVEKEIGVEISSRDFDEKIQADISVKKRIKDDNIDPSFSPDISGGFGDCKDGDGLRETIFPMKKPLFDLANIIKMLSKKTDQRFEDIDILEIAAMKGIHFAPLKWCRPGGYETKKHKSLGNP